MTRVPNEADMSPANAVQNTSQVGDGKTERGTIWSFVQFLLRLLPVRLSRMLFLASAYNHLVDRKLFRGVRDGELNDAMELVSLNETVSISHNVYPTIWSREKIHTMLSVAGVLNPCATNGNNMTECLEDFCTQLVKLSPRSLRYASVDAMVLDTMNLFKNYLERDLAPSV